jgi:hypothetical protein
MVRTLFSAQSLRLVVAVVDLTQVLRVVQRVVPLLVPQLVLLVLLAKDSLAE